MTRANVYKKMVDERFLKNRIDVEEAHIVMPHRGTFHSLTQAHLVLERISQENVITHTYIPFERITKISVEGKYNGGRKKKDLDK